MPVYNYTTLDDPSAANYTQAIGINSTGQIVGYYYNPLSIGFIGYPG
jgi:hypothetical protein